MTTHTIRAIRAERRTRLAVLVAGALLASGASVPAPTAATPATAPAHAPLAEAVVVLAPASGSLVSGQLQLHPQADGLRLTGTIGGFAPGSQHGFHVHEHGDCRAADASSAGGHFNPAAAPHGRMGHGLHHAGDVDNLQADAAGVAHVDLVLPGLTLGDGGADDVLGRAFIVHADADDYRSQPAGNAGARVACGVIRAAGTNAAP
jgi:Cu-Zn family superoxide dismutase